MVGESVATAASTTVDAAPPSAASGQERGPEQQVVDFLAAFSRAVQRASMYPEGHPAVPLGIGPVVSTLQPLLSYGSLSIAVGRTRILVAVGAYPPTEHASPWLAARLFKRGISSFTVNTDFDAQEASRLVAWIASASDRPDDPLPEVAGVALSRFDASHVRFREDASTEPSATPETTVAWRTLTATLLPQNEAPAPSDDTPEGLASRIREVVTAAEGTGVAALADRLVSVRRHLEQTNPATRAILRQKLAVLVTQLLPELRSTVLSVHSTDDPEKVLMLLELVDHLPVSVVHEIAGKIGVGAPPVPVAFSRFLDKLVRLSTDDPVLERTLTASGFPYAPSTGIADTAKPATDGAEFVPDTYRVRLEQLVDMSSLAPSLVSPNLTAAVDATSLEHHVARIAMLEAGRAPGSVDTAPYLQWLSQMAPKALATGDLPHLAKIADLVLRIVSAAPTVDRATQEIVERLRAFYQQPTVVDAAVHAVAAQPTGSSSEATVVLAAGGVEAYRQAMAWFEAAASDRTSRDRVAAALLSADTTVQRALIPALSGSRRLAESAVAVLGAIDPSVAIEVALALAANHSADIRGRAVAWLVDTPLTSTKLSRVLARAFEDDDARVVTLALNAAASRPGPAGEALLAFASRRAPLALLPLQAKAMQLLVESGHDAVGRLSRLLRDRRFAYSVQARRLSATMARTLSRSGLLEGQAAARGWHLSPAGLLSWLSRTSAVEA